MLKAGEFHPAFAVVIVEDQFEARDAVERRAVAVDVEADVVARSPRDFEQCLADGLLAQRYQGATSGAFVLRQRGAAAHCEPVSH